MVFTKKPRRTRRPGLVGGREDRGLARSSDLEGIVGFTVVGEVADAVHGVFEEGRDGEDCEANGRAGEGADEEEREAGGFAERKGKKVLMFNVLPTSSAGELSPAPITLPTSFTFSARSTPSRKRRGPTPIAR